MLSSILQNNAFFLQTNGGKQDLKHKSDFGHLSASNICKLACITGDIITIHNVSYYWDRLMFWTYNFDQFKNSKIQILNVYMIYLPYKFTILVGKCIYIYIGYTIHTECRGSHVTPAISRCPSLPWPRSWPPSWIVQWDASSRPPGKKWENFGDGKLGPGETNTSINQLRYGWGIWLISPDWFHQFFDFPCCFDGWKTWSWIVQTFLIFTRNPGEIIQFDYIICFSGLVQPPTSI